LLTLIQSLRRSGLIRLSREKRLSVFLFISFLSESILLRSFPVLLSIKDRFIFAIGNTYELEL